MDRNEIKKVWAAYQEVQEAQKKKLDPVGKADADIDNDGDVDKSDEYLHNRRKAIKKAMKEEMSDEQKSKREKIVKSMKSKTSEFKDKYGDRWKEVMYATATKMAMKEETVQEANQNPKANEAEKMADNFTASDKKFASAHGGIDAKTPEVDGMKAADQTVAAIKASEPGENHKNRAADNTQGDKAIVQSPTKVKEAKTFSELMQVLSDK